ncbi:chemokine XC receptor 1 [Echeneis naucrates]|uniref:Chemokine XC receptor 1-like n=1 Tax=Echeneis naucrates TaxID=173247 RepID=A0A665WHV5_ECHNA|nr:chemokine XC receptor 1-like [Echeneis naucrates]
MCLKTYAFLRRKGVISTHSEKKRGIALSAVITKFPFRTATSCASGGSRNSTILNNFTMSNISEDYIEEDVIYLCDEFFDLTNIAGGFFIFVFILSILGNSLLLCVLLLYESLKNPTNLFVLNLAFSDLTFTFTLPFWATDLLHNWIFGDFLCKLMTAAYFIGLYSSIILLTAITVDRFIMVVLHNWPTNCVKRQRFAVCACVAAWVISITASLSDAINVKLETGEQNISFCVPLYSETESKVGYFLQVSLLFLLPLVIIIFCYSAILKTVFKTTNRKKHRTVAVVFCIVAAFFICWGPYHIMLFIQALYVPQTCNDQERFYIVHNIFQMLAYSHCCMNPVLYMLSQKLRKHLMDSLTCAKEWRKNRVKNIGQSTAIFQNETTTVQNTTVILELPTK